jgi:hypothetical protein
MRYYKLDVTGEHPIQCNDMFDADACFSDENIRKVKVSPIFPEGELSTVFLCLDHSFQTDSEPVLWESLVFGGPHDGEMRRCAGTRTDALRMHTVFLEELNK